MRKRDISLVLMASVVMAASAYEIVKLTKVDGSFLYFLPEVLDEIRYSADKSNIEIEDIHSNVTSVPVTQLADIRFAAEERQLVVNFDGDNASVVNGYDADKVSVQIDGAKVVVTPADGEMVFCTVTGTTASGQLKFYGNADKYVVLDNASITNDSGSALNFQGSGSAVIELKGKSALSDSKKYSTPDGEDEKGTINATGDIIFGGDGSLSLTGLKKHGVNTSGFVTLNGPDLQFSGIAGDGIHCEGFLMQDGAYASTDTEGDGIDAGAGTMEIRGGKIDVDIAADDIKGLKADGDITVYGGEISLAVSSSQGKGIKTKGDMLMSGGSVSAVMTGDVVVFENDPSYCTTIKTDGNFTMTGGSVNIISSGKAGKGISADGNALFEGGDIIIECSGNGDTYTNTDNEADAYSATCITVDGNLTILGGKFNLSNSGTAGKCLKADNEIIIGNDVKGPEITARTTGQRILVSEGTSTGGFGGMGGMDNADYSNPKVVKADGNLTVNNGTLRLSSTVEGGEGLESKDILTINGGDIDISTADDCINASNHIQLNGGVVHCIASNNDAIDSNGTITMAGGVVIAIGTRTPECGIDCDNNRFAITGGVLFGLGGDTSAPTASACTQRAVRYSANLAQNALVTVVDPDGKHILSFKNPVNLGNSVMLFSAPGITEGSHTIYMDGTLAGGKEVYELTLDATYTPGTVSTTFTPTSMYTTLGGGMGGDPGGMGGDPGGMGGDPGAGGGHGGGARP